MNPLFEAARGAVTDGWLMGLMTVFFFLTFAAYAVWAWLPGNRPHMDRMAKAALDDEAPSLPPGVTP